MIFIDTDVAIAFRDGDLPTQERVASLDETPFLSIITRIELENGVYRGADTARRRALLDRMLRTFAVEALGEPDILAYGAIVGRLGYDRRLTLDRLIAAQAMARGATLVTRNARDFQKIEELRLEAW